MIYFKQRKLNQLKHLFLAQDIFQERKLKYIFVQSQETKLTLSRDFEKVTEKLDVFIEDLVF